MPVDPEAVARHLAMHAPGPLHDPSTLTSVDLWMSWVAIAADHAATATAARERALLSPLEQVPRAHDDELRAALVAITASAFALDAFYLAVAQQIEPPATPVKQPRSASLLDTLQRGFALTGDLQQTRLGVEMLYTLRNRAVHHETQFRASVLHPSGRLHVTEEGATYTAEQAHATVELVAELILRCLAGPDPQRSGLVAWCSRHAHVADYFSSVRSRGGREPEVGSEYG